VVYDPIMGPQAWPGGPHPAALARMQAEAQAARQAEIKAARDAMRASGTVCDLEYDNVGGTGPCGVPAAGRCIRCSRAFCQSHQSSRPLYTNLCQECQTQEVAQNRRAAEQRAATEQDRARREADEHAAKVARHETKAGWAEAKEKMARLDELIGKSYVQSPPSQGATAAALVLIVVGVVVGIVACASSPTGAGVALGILLLPMGWAAWTLAMSTRQSRREERIRERNKLERARGCGDMTCERCKYRQ